MDIDDIKRGLRSEIKKRENEQYATFQCNVRQMCKDVLAKLEEQEQEIADLNVMLQDACLERDENPVVDELTEQIRHQKYKRCLAMAQEWRNYAAFCGMQSSCHNHRGFGKTAEKYTCKECHAWKCVHRCKELAEKFKTKSTAL